MVRQTSGGSSASADSPTPSIDSLSVVAPQSVSTKPSGFELPACSSSTSSSGLGSSPLANSVLGLNEGHVGCSVIAEPICSICKAAVAVARCNGCPNRLCAHCVVANQFHLCCDNHSRVEMSMGGSSGVGPELDSIRQLVEESQLRIGDLRSVAKNAENSRQRLAKNLSQAQNEVYETFNMMQRMLEERKTETLRDLDKALTAKQMDLAMVAQRAHDVVDNIQQVSDFVETLLKRAGGGELQVCKRPLEQRLNALLQEASQAAFTTDNHHEEVHFVASKTSTVRDTLKTLFGHVRVSRQQQPPISRPVANTTNVDGPFSLNDINHSLVNSIIAPSPSTGQLKNLLMEPSQSSTLPHSSSSSSVFHLPSGLTSGFESSSSSTADSGASSTSSSGGSGSSMAKGFFRGLNSLVADLPGSDYERWSNGINDCGNKLYPSNLSAVHGQSNHVGFQSLMGNNGLMQAPHSSSSTNYGLGLMETNKFVMNAPTLMGPSLLRTQMRRQKMIYHCKFGEFGIMEGQFTEPSGVAVNAQNDIIVADTNNHRIQIFDKEGRFKFQFGECGKRDGQLLYPNRVAVVKQSGDIVVTERSPTHQVQIYNQYGQFVRKFGATILQHPRGVCVDSMGRIIVVECKVMRVIIFDQRGNVLNKFGCSKHLEFPNGVVVNDRQEIFISDNRAHCVKVFSYEGIFLRQIGGEGITNYPIGVGINSSGHVTIADNHNNFNLTVFSQEGQLISALESKVKHAQCFDVALMDDGSVVLASKDYRLYVYRYLQTL